MRRAAGGVRAEEDVMESGFYNMDCMEAMKKDGGN